MVLSLVADAQTAMTTSQRNQVRGWIEELISSTKVSRKSSCILLTKRQYIAWFGLQEGMSREEAALQWDRDVNDANVYKERDGSSLLVSVRKPTELIEEHSMEKRRRIEQRQEGLEEDLGARRPHQTRTHSLRVRRSPSQNPLLCIRPRPHA